MIECLRIDDYFHLFGEYLSQKWVVFFSDTTETLKPFEPWENATFAVAEYPKHTLEWWISYNKLKHDRLRYRKRGTLEHVTSALGALLLVILHCEAFRETVGTSGWMKALVDNPVALLDDFHNPQPSLFGLVETRLFAYPAGWMKVKTTGLHGEWGGPSSQRFKDWFRDQTGE